MDTNLIEALSLLFTGMGGVFLALTFFYFLIFVINKVNNELNKKKVSKKLHVSNEKEKVVKSDEIAPEILAVIAATVFATLQEKVKIKTIKFLTQPDDTSWSRIGRLSLIESHVIKK